jgi:hypothetical protein
VAPPVIPRPREPQLRILTLLHVDPTSQLHTT